MPIEATVKADTVYSGQRISTLSVTMPKSILAQFNTHRAFSRNSASSRAIPVSKMLANIRADMFIPELSKAGKGMVSNDLLTPAQLQDWNDDVRELFDVTAKFAEKWAERGHKQHVNRYLEPFLFTTVLVTATDWDNFFRLRLDHASQPEMQQVAKAMHDALQESKPSVDRWHIPFSELMPPDAPIGVKVMIASARCARLSYQQQDGTFSTDSDLKLGYKLWADGHLSPFEHCAFDTQTKERYGNFTTWANLRYFLERNFTVPF